MKELIKVNYSSERPTVNGRDLYEALEVKTAYKDWFPRMCDYGFEEGKDFCSILSESTGGRPSLNHQLTISMAKELCMLQRNEKGKVFRQYFIAIEEKWNSPESIMARALQFANEKLMLLEKENSRLSDKVAIQGQQILEMKKVSNSNNQICGFYIKSMPNKVIRVLKHIHLQVLMGIHIQELILTGLKRADYSSMT